MYISFGFAARIYSYSESNVDLVIMRCAIPLVILGSVIALAFQEDVRTSMGCLRRQ